MYLAVNCKYVCKMNVHPVFFQYIFCLNKNSKNFISWHHFFFKCTSGRCYYRLLLCYSPVMVTMVGILLAIGAMVFVL